MEVTGTIFCLRGFTSRAFLGVNHHHPAAMCCIATIRSYCKRKAIKWLSLCGLLNIELGTDIRFLKSDHRSLPPLLVECLLFNKRHRAHSWSLPCSVRKENARMTLPARKWSCLWNTQVWTQAWWLEILAALNKK